MADRQADRQAPESAQIVKLIIIIRILQNINFKIANQLNNGNTPQNQGNTPQNNQNERNSQKQGDSSPFQRLEQNNNGSGSGKQKRNFSVRKSTEDLAITNSNSNIR